MAPSVGSAAAVLMAVLLVGVALSAAAQAPPPAPKEPPAENSRPEEKAPPRTPGPATPAPAKPGAQPFVPKDPAVEAILATKPDAPDEWARAAKILADLKRPDLAKDLLKKILDAKLDEGQLAALADRFGTAVFAEMASRPELAPEARSLADAVLGAVRRRHETPDRLANLIKDLADPSPEAKARAVEGLRQAGAAAVAPLVAVLADPARKAEHEAVRGVLAQLGPDAVRPLAACLQSPDAALVVQVIRVLGSSGAGEVSIFLLAPFASPESPPEVRQAAAEALGRLVGPLPTPAEAAGILSGRAGEYLDRRRVVRAEADGSVVLWQWDPAAKQPVARRCSADVAAAALAARLAGDALAIAPGDAAVRELYLLAALERASREAGLDSPLPLDEGTPAARLAEFGPPAIESALARALAAGHGPAAAAAARILGQVGTAEDLLGNRAEPSPLARAMRSPDPRVRLAAVAAIMNLQPVRPFAGSSYLSEALGFLATSTGARRAMIAGRDTEAARQIGGFLQAMGYEVETATTGRQMLQALFGSADFELVLVDARIDDPPLGLLVQQLRHDCRTASLPVGVLAGDDQFDRAKRTAREDPLLETFPKPHDQAAAKWQVDRLLALARRDGVPPEVRQRNAAEALGWLAELGAASSFVYNLQRAEDSALSALYAPRLGQQAVAVLAKMGTPRSQRALVDLASRATQPLPLRKAALEAFRESTAKHGILLSTDEILRQYDRYNQSAQADRPTQAVLGAILDAIEAPSKAKKAAEEGMTKDQVPMSKE